VALPGGAMLELFTYLEPLGRRVTPAPNDPGSFHVCLEVDDLDAAVRGVRAAGFRTSSPEPVEIPFGDWQGWRDIYVIGPDGVTVELSQRPRAGL
jgi:catechol 2,3-dioxygenase-like lactoylglutathione lyase family enzyme